jgi:hypothetical protein
MRRGNIEPSSDKMDSEENRGESATAREKSTSENFQESPGDKTSAEASEEKFNIICGGHELLDVSEMIMFTKNPNAMFRQAL